MTENMTGMQDWTSLEVHSEVEAPFNPSKKALSAPQGSLKRDPILQPQESLLSFFWKTRK